MLSTLSTYSTVQDPADASSRLYDHAFKLKAKIEALQKTRPQGCTFAPGACVLVRGRGCLVADVPHRGIFTRHCGVYA